MSTHDELVKRIRFAINDPGAFVKRELDEHGGPAESVGQWGARAVLAALTESTETETSSTSYERLRPWIQSVIEGWSLRTDTMARRDLEYHGPADLANQVVAVVLPMLVRRDVALETAHAELTRQAKTLAEVRREHDQLRGELAQRNTASASSGEVPLSCGCGISPEGAPGAYGCSAGCMEPVPSGVDDLRDRIATAMHHAQCGCDQWTAHEGEDGDPTYNLMADAVMAVAGPELARRAEQTAKVDRFVHQISNALGIEPTTDLGELGTQVQAQVAWLKREFVTSNNTNADWVAHDLRVQQKLAALREQHRAVHKPDCPGTGDCPGGCGYDGKDKTLYCYTCTDTYAVAIEEQPCAVRRVLDA